MSFFFLTSLRHNKIILILIYLRKIFGPVRDTGTGEWRRRYNRELEDLYGEANIVGIMKSRRLQWLGHVERMDTSRWSRLAFDFKPSGTTEDEMDGQSQERSGCDWRVGKLERQD